MSNSREIEVKLLLEQLPFDRVNVAVKEIVSNLFSSYSSSLMNYETGLYSDRYWRAANADFVRLRAGKKPELTCKRSDRKTAFNREERSFAIPATEEAINSLEDVLELALGHSISTPIVWKYADWKFKTYTVSVISNFDDRNNTFVEIEGDTESIVTEMSSLFRESLSRHFDGATVYKVANSFFDIYVMKNGIELLT